MLVAGCVVSGGVGVGVLACPPDEVSRSVFSGVGSQNLSHTSMRSRNGTV
jgi:hypothetical protein